MIRFLPVFLSAFLLCTQLSACRGDERQPVPLTEAAGSSAIAAPITPDPLWDAIDPVLADRVDDRGQVRYEGLLGDASFARAWRSLLAVREEELATWPESERLAFWINAYNLATLKLIADHYPIEGRFPLDLVLPDNSILMIPGRWDNAYPIAGATRSLDSIEHEILRVRFQEPRIHFAIVCASIGCPVLRQEAYRGSRIESQLEEQARRYFRSETGLRVREGDPPKIELTKILDWFGEDFLSLPPDAGIEAVQGGDRASLLARVARWFPPEVQTLLRTERLRTGWLDYDWSLNEQPSPDPGKG